MCGRCQWEEMCYAVIGVRLAGNRGGRGCTIDEALPPDCEPWLWFCREITAETAWLGGQGRDDVCMPMNTF